jgi:hypothetical protein
MCNSTADDEVSVHLCQRFEGLVIVNPFTP